MLSPEEIALLLSENIGDSNGLADNQGGEPCTICGQVTPEGLVNSEVGKFHGGCFYRAKKVLWPVFMQMIRQVKL